MGELRRILLAPLVWLCSCCTGGGLSVAVGIHLVGILRMVSWVLGGSELRVLYRSHWFGELVHLK
jgi:hypothetical protein